MAEYEQLPEGYSIEGRLGEARQERSRQEREGYEQLPAKYRPPGYVETPYEKDWGAAPWSEVASSAVTEFVPSVGRAAKGIYEAVTSPGTVVEGLKQAGTGIASKARGAFGEQQDPEQKAKDETVINALIEPFTSVAGFKKALATDPFSVLSAAAIPVSGGASAAGTGAKALGTASMAGKALRGAELAGKTAAGVMDPIYGTAKLAGLGYTELAKPAAKTAIAGTSGVSKPAIDLAYEAGRTTEPALKNAFNTFAKGEGNPVEFSRTVDKASTAMRDAEMARWKADKANIIAMKTPIDPQPILEAIQKARDDIGPRNMAFGTSLQAHRDLDYYENLLRKKLQSPRNSTLLGMDMAKRTLYADAQKAHNPMTSNALLSLHNGVRQSMFKVSDEYVGLMEKYQEMLDAMKTVKKSLNTGNNASAINELNTFIRGMNDQYKGQFIAQLAKYDPRIPYMVAGSTIHQAAGNPSNWGKVLSIGQLANIGWGLQRGEPLHYLGAAGSFGAQSLFGSPKAVGNMAYGAGTVARGLEKVGDVFPAGTGEVISGTARSALPAGGQLSRMQDEELLGSLREGRKTGGRVVTADKLVSMVDRAKKNINNQTETLLKTPDSQVAQALEVANRHLEG